jgi:hypothetical protein
VRRSETHSDTWAELCELRRRPTRSRWRSPRRAPVASCQVETPLDARVSELVAVLTAAEHPLDFAITCSNTHYYFAPLGGGPTRAQVRRRPPLVLEKCAGSKKCAESGAGHQQRAATAAPAAATGFSTTRACRAGGSDVLNAFVPLCHYHPPPLPLPFPLDLSPRAESALSAASAAVARGSSTRTCFERHFVAEGLQSHGRTRNSRRGGLPPRAET